MQSARARLDAAHERAHEAESALLQSRSALFVRGEEKARLLEALEEARAELTEAERDLPRWVEAARNAGVPPGALRAFEGNAD